jgi:putative DNA primase/helicase
MHASARAERLGTSEVLDTGPAAAAAIWYATQWGVLVAPADPEIKKPLIKTGRNHEEHSSRAPDVIAAWTQWRQPGSRVAVVTGCVSGVLVIDADVTERFDGLESLRDLERRIGTLPATPTQQTQRGEQRIFRYPAGAEIKSSASVLAPGVDIKALGGIFIAPPAPDRRWLVDAHPADLALAELPAAWIQALVALRTPTSAALPVVEQCIGRGRRNSTLASFAGSMRRRGMSEGAILAALLVENGTRCDPPLPDAEVRLIARSVTRYQPTPARNCTSSFDELATRGLQ